MCGREEASGGLSTFFAKTTIYHVRGTCRVSEWKRLAGIEASNAKPSYFVFQRHILEKSHDHILSKTRSTPNEGRCRRTTSLEKKRRRRKDLWSISRRIRCSNLRALDATYEGFASKLPEKRRQPAPLPRFHVPRRVLIE